MDYSTIINMVILDQVLADNDYALLNAENKHLKSVLSIRRRLDSFHNKFKEHIRCEIRNCYLMQKNVTFVASYVC